MKIAFAGSMGAGKDVSVRYLIRKYGGKKIAFSDPIYNILEYAQSICGFKVEKDRKFLQYIGTEWAREKDPDIWVNLALKNVPKHGNVFCSDIRFTNEFSAFKKDGWIIIKLARNKFDNRRIGTGDKNHISEHDFENIDDKEFDYIIHNNTSLHFLYSTLDKIIQKIMNKELKERILRDINEVLSGGPPPQPRQFQIAEI